MIETDNGRMGTKGYEREDRLRSYLTLGTMASALRDKSFLQRFAVRSGRKEFVLESPAIYPSFDVKVINLSLRPKRLSIEAYLDQFIRENRIDPVMICATATSAQLDEARKVAGAARVISSDALRVIGGPHVSVLPAEYLKDSEYQVACIGEGVETLTEIALRLN